MKIGEIVQKILPHAKIKLEVEALSENAQDLVDRFPKPFDLSKAPLLRAKLCNLNNSRSLLLIDSHHIVIDGTSLNIILRDFYKLYNGEELKENDLKYADYAVWEKYFVNSDKIKPYEEFWSNKFKGQEFTALNLPYDYPLSNIKSFKGEKLNLTLSKEQFSKIENTAKANNVSNYSIFLTALYILLYKYTSQNDIIVGSPFAGRSFKEIQEIIGMFVNNIVLNKHIDPNLNLSTFLQEVHKDVLDSISNQPYPYELLQKNLGNSSLLDVMFTYQNEHTVSPFEILTANTNTSKFNLWFEIIPTTLDFNLEYNTDLFKRETAQSLMEHYLFILEQIIEGNNIKISDFNIITKKEAETLKKFNDTYMPIDKNLTIMNIFEEQVKKTPDNIAVVCNDKSLTYEELNRYANSLAHYLIKTGIKPNDIVCINTNRSLETIVAMLGILKAGGAFFNVDPTYPMDRTKYYIENSKTEYLLVQRELKNNITGIKHTIEIDLANNEIYLSNFENPKVSLEPTDLSYIIYTSGSTGTPKGVMLNQIGFANMAKAMTYALDYLRDGKNHAIASVTSTPFDIFVYEIFVSLTHGMKVVMANNSEHRNPKLLEKLIRKNNVDVMTVTPSLMKICYDNREKDTALALVKNMVFGGEPLPQKFVDDLRALADDITIFNIYGPSEITILSNVQNLNGEKDITVGPPTKNTHIHILDNNLKEVPIGVAGEIYISGIQVGLGYIRNPERTRASFLDNPFGEGKIYKSGDIGRWTFDGKVQILGRVDHQVKLRGLRIELGEIENRIFQVDGVTDTVVNKIELDGKEVLCGYYVANKDVPEKTVKEYLRKYLPPYMVPTYIMRLDSMPYTINRKIDRKALPNPTVNSDIKSEAKKELSKKDIKKMNSNEEKILEIWKQVLNTENIGLDDNFFDIGGDSIAAINVQIEAVKYGLNIEYSDIFNFPTVRKLANKIPPEDDDFIKNYDYSRINKVLARNNLRNLKRVTKINVRKCFAYWCNRLSWCSYCL